MFENSPVPPEEEPVTSRDEAGEPSGEEDPQNEREQFEEKEAVEAEDPLARTQRERDEYLDLARRSQADFENYRKRAAKEAAAEQHLAEGVRLVHSELIAVLERNGVQQFDPSGERFDPGEHEALSMRPQDGAESGVVIDVVEKGYRANGTVLRPARVVVSA